MKLVAHIMAKDVRRLRAEIGVVLLLNAILVWRDASPAGQPSGVWWPLLPLVPLGWVVFIARLVHGERLVGDDAWWLAKPYSRLQLLAAKALLALAVVHGVSFAGDCVVLAAKGFQPLVYLPQLLTKQLRWLTGLTLPAFALATLSLGMAQFVLGFLILFGLIGVVSSQVHGWSVAGVELRAAVLLSLLCLTAIVTSWWQYARRRTRLSLCLFGTGTAAACAVFIGLPAQWTMRMVYPEPDVGPELRASAGAVSNTADAAARIRGSWLLPVELEARRPEMDWHREGVMGEVRAGGARLRPKLAIWTPPERGGGNVALLLRPQDAPRVRNRKVDVTVRVALREWRNVRAGRLRIEGPPVRVEGVGTCRAIRNPESLAERAFLVTCESPIDLPSPLRMELRTPAGRVLRRSLTGTSYVGVTPLMMLSPIHRLQGEFNQFWFVPDEFKEPERWAAECEILVYRQAETRRGIRTLQWSGFDWEKRVQVSPAVN